LSDFARAVTAHVRITSTKDPTTGLYMLAAGTYGYQVDANEAMFQCLMLDVLGDHAEAAKLLKTFVALQGSTRFAGTFSGDQKALYGGVKVAPGIDYGAATEYSLDHGTVLWALGEHYRYTRDKAWLGEVAPSMKRAADWILEQRKLTEVYDGQEKVPEYGLLPSARLEDPSEWGHWFAVNAYALAGIRNLALCLSDIGDADAKHYMQEAATYRDDLRASVIRASQAAPVVRLQNNTYAPWFPVHPYERIRIFGPDRTAYYLRYGPDIRSFYKMSSTREVLYGPLILLLTGTFDSDEPEADWILNDWEDNLTMSTPLNVNVHGWVEDKDWFSRGGTVFQANLQNPIQIYQKRHENAAALRSFYNGFVSLYYPTANVLSEESHSWVHASGPFYKSPDEASLVNRIRDLLVLENDDSLWLAEGAPRQWLAPGQAIDVRSIATYFGPVSYQIHAQTNALKATVELPTQSACKDAWLYLRVPGNKHIRSVTIDNKPWNDFDANRERIRLPSRKGTISISVELSTTSGQGE
jgi:hypothetical protein